MIAILIVGRAWLAWGLDRMGRVVCTGREWSGRAAVQEHVGHGDHLALGVVVMVLGSAAPWPGLVGGGLQFASVFLVTGIWVLVFPYRKSVRGIW